MNHVPDDALAAIDSFGEALLLGSPPPITEPLRRDLRLRVRPRDDGQTAVCRYETEHNQTPARLRERGSFVTTIVDNVDARFESWGVVPPEAYGYTETVDGTHRYEGVLQLP